MSYIIEPMRVEDIPEVMEIEKESFSLPWPASAYRRELRTPSINRYLVARHCTGPLPPPPEERDDNKRHFLSSLLPFAFHPSPSPSPYPIIGYGGLWLMIDEAHITTLAVKPEHRGHGVGELLLVGLIETAIEMNASWVTLEVRVSNYVAQNLYRKYGFKETGIRRHYYSDNGEDALIMWSDPVNSVSFQKVLQKLKTRLAEKLSKIETEAPPSPSESKSFEHPEH
ncbi:MAG: ribosomal protein S18-alanine N-acetyltransferase [Chloroflexi bacterium]|nr:ribosomal protein S18-alanine N-acetyltransferase [Chloroflexota bacterium]